MKKSLLASAIVLAFGLAGQAMAHDHNNPPADPSGTATVTGNGAAADNGSFAQTNALTNAFNPTKVVAMSVLTGSVSGNKVIDIGNSAKTQGFAKGGSNDSNGGKGGASVARDGNQTAAGAGHAGTASASASSQSGNAQSGNGGNGGTGGTGTGGTGQNVADAGTFNMSNNMTGAAQSAAGIVAMAQNSGASSLIQQQVNMQANVSANH